MKPISDNFTAHIDGSPTGIEVVLEGLGQTTRISKWIGRQGNNVAKYVALLEALQYAESINAKKLYVFSDSDVVVKQMDGR
jgi:ribonuclease HI